MKQTYRTHFNGCQPYKVVINDTNQVTVYDNEIIPPTLCTTYNPQTIFIGKSPKNDMTIHSGDYGPKFNGNTILLHLCDNTYIFIGTFILQFESLAKIVEFVSPVGNNDVPYPYAKDVNYNIYLLIENVVLKHNTLLLKRMMEYDNPYIYYYRYHDITDDVKSGRRGKAIIKNFHNIKKFYVGNNHHILAYTPFPDKEYDKFIEANEGDLYIVNTHNEKKLLQKDEYVKIIEAFGLVNSFEPLIMDKLEF